MRNKPRRRAAASRRERRKVHKERKKKLRKYWSINKNFCKKSHKLSWLVTIYK